jgi:hypothetical protein
MRNLPWFRFYHESLDDPKVQRLEPALFKAWVNLLCLASRHGGELPGIDDVAFALRLSVPECESVLTALRNQGLLDGDDATLAPHNWHNRQPLSDADSTAAERQQRYRERRRTPDGNASRPDDSNALHHALPVTERHPARTEQNRTEREEEGELTGEARKRADGAAAPAPKPAPAAPSKKSRDAGPQPTEAGYEFVGQFCSETGDAFSGDRRRREALYADELIRKAGGSDAALEYVRWRIGSGQSPVLQFCARDYVPTWRQRMQARASPNGRIGALALLDRVIAGGE